MVRDLEGKSSRVIETGTSRWLAGVHVHVVHAAIVARVVVRAGSNLPGVFRETDRSAEVIGDDSRAKTWDDREKNGHGSTLLAVYT